MKFFLSNYKLDRKNNYNVKTYHIPAKDYNCEIHRYEKLLEIVSLKIRIKSQNS
jgi:hypothetical protein